MGCNKKVVLCFKRGDTFNLNGILQDKIGTPIDLTGYSISSQVRDGGWLVSTLDCSITGAASGKYNITKSHTDTQNWPDKDLKMDIQFTTASSKKISTETILLKDEKDQTI